MKSRMVGWLENWIARFMNSIVAACLCVCMSVYHKFPRIWSLPSLEGFLYQRYLPTLVKTHISSNSKPHIGSDCSNLQLLNSSLSLYLDSCLDRNLSEIERFISVCVCLSVCLSVQEAQLCCLIYVASLCSTSTFNQRLRAFGPSLTVKIQPQISLAQQHRNLVKTLHRVEKSECRTSTDKSLEAQVPISWDFFALRDWLDGDFCGCWAYSGSLICPTILAVNAVVRNQSNFIYRRAGIFSTEKPNSPTESLESFEIVWELACLDPRLSNLITIWFAPFSVCLLTIQSFDSFLQDLMKLFGSLTQARTTKTTTTKKNNDIQWELTYHVSSQSISPYSILNLCHRFFDGSLVDHRWISCLKSISVLEWSSWIIQTNWKFPSKTP